MSKNPNNLWKLIKIAHIDTENLQVFWMPWGISKKFSEKMCLMIILKVTKKARFHPIFRRYIFRKTTGAGGDGRRVGGGGDGGVKLTLT